MKVLVLLVFVLCWCDLACHDVNGLSTSWPSSSPCECDSGDSTGFEEVCGQKEGPCRVNGGLEIACGLGGCSCTCRIHGNLEFGETSSVKCKGGGTGCTLVMWVGGNVTFFPGASVQVSTLWFESTESVSTMTGSVINATGMGLVHRSPDRKFLVDHGGSNGGRGGQTACGHAIDLKSPQIGDPTAPWENWGDGTSGFGFGGASLDILDTSLAGWGGGRIYISALRSITVAGIIVSDGSPASAICLADCGGGAGGTIVLNATDLVFNGGGAIKPPIDESAISAVGANTYRNSSGAGGGGKIALLARNSLSSNGAFEVRAHGGLAKLSNGQDDPSNCLGGGAGTILRALYSKNASSFIGWLQISNCPSLGPCNARDFALASTPITFPPPNKARDSPNDVKLVSVQINKYASVNATRLNLDEVPNLDAILSKTSGQDPGVFLNVGRLVSVQNIRAYGLQLSSGSLLQALDKSLVFVKNGQFSVDAASFVMFTGRMDLEITSIAIIEGSIRANDQVVGMSSELTSHVHIYAYQLQVKSGSAIVSERISIFSQGLVEIDSKLSATYIPNCAQVLQRKICKDFYHSPLLLPGAVEDALSNYSLSIIVNSMVLGDGAKDLLVATTDKNVTVEDQLTLQKGGEITGRSILLCAGSVTVIGKISSTGNGCLSDFGPGAGCTSSGGAGGGAGHGGLGGAGFKCPQRGNTYDKPSNPILSGSGGGSGSNTAGGNGGGVIVIGAENVIHMNGIVESDGTDGKGDGQHEGAAGGGGSGGSIQISAAVICGSTSSEATRRISAGGGNGGNGGGGGGGGGLIAVEFMDENQIHPNHKVVLLPEVYQDGGTTKCTHFGNFSTLISVNGGKPGPLNNGKHVLLVDDEQEEEQEEDAFAEKKKREDEDDHIVRGVRSGLPGHISSPNCSFGHGGSWCELCGFGFYKDHVGQEECVPCNRRSCIEKNKCDWMAEGSSNPECPVICKPGYILPNCITPLDNLIQSMGGIVVFAMVIAGIGLLLIITFACVCTRVEWCPGYYANEAKLRRKRLRTAQAFRDHRRAMGFDILQRDGSSAVLPDTDDFGMPLLQRTPGSNHDGTPTLDEFHSLHQGDDGLVSMRGVSSQAFGGTNHVPPTGTSGSRGIGVVGQKHAGEKLSEADIPFFITRVYFHGTNSTTDPWQLCPELPEVLRDRRMIDPVEYRKMALQVNELAPHPTITKYVSALLHLVCYPLGYMYLQRQRLIRSYVLEDFFANYDHACVINTRARSLMNTFKFGRDKDSTVCYLDILKSRVVSAKDREQRLPMLLFLSGDGSYWSPFSIDPRDMLVRAVPHLVELRTFIDQTWADMLTQLNAKFRSVDPFMLSKTAQPALRVLEKFTKGSGDRLGGLQVQLGIFATPIQGGDENDQDMPMSSKRRRLAILLTRDGLPEDLDVPSPTNTPPTGDSLEGSIGQPSEFESSIPIHFSPGSSIADENGSLPGGKIPSEKQDNNHQESSLSTSFRERRLIDDLMLISADEKRAGAAAVEAFENEERIRQATTSSFDDSTSRSMPDSPLTGSMIRDEALQIGDAISIAQLDSAIMNGINEANGPGPGPGSGSGPGPMLVNASVGVASYSGQALYADYNSLVDPMSLPFDGRILQRQIQRDLGDESDQEDEEAQDEDNAIFQETRLNELPFVDHFLRVMSYLRQHLGILVNRPPRKNGSQLFSRAYISTLLAIDATCTFFLLTTFYCVDHNGHRCIRTLFILANAIYPFALIVGPLLGLTFVVFPLSGMGRHYAIWNTLAVINAIVACILSIIYREKFSFETGVLSVSLLVVKLLQSRTVDRYIAMVETDRGLKKEKN